MWTLPVVSMASVLLLLLLLMLAAADFNDRKLAKWLLASWLHPHSFASSIQVECNNNDDDDGQTIHLETLALEQTYCSDKQTNKQTSLTTTTTTKPIICLLVLIFCVWVFSLDDDDSFSRYLKSFGCTTSCCHCCDSCSKILQLQVKFCLNISLCVFPKNCPMTPTRANTQTFNYGNLYNCERFLNFRPDQEKRAQIIVVIVVVYSIEWNVLWLMCVICMFKLLILMHPRDVATIHAYTRSLFGLTSK